MNLNIFERIVFITLFLISFSIFIFSLLKSYKTFKLAKGQDDCRTDNISKRLLNVIKIILIQSKLFNYKISGIIHYIIFWGFILVNLGTLNTIITVFCPYCSYKSLIKNHYVTEVILFLQDSANFLVLIAVIVALVKRFVFKPKRLASLDILSKLDALAVLILIFVLVSSSLVYYAFSLKLFYIKSDYMFISQILSSVLPNNINLPLAAKITWWIHYSCFLGFLVFLPYSKHQHLIWVWFNLYLKNLKPMGRARPMEFDENAQSFGASTVNTFTFKSMLDAHTCVECGRCVDNCPANISAKPLDPRKLMKVLKKSLHKFARLSCKSLSSQNIENAVLITKDQITEEEIWACTFCGACMQSCPLEIEHLPVILEMRRFLSLTEASFPNSVGSVFRNLENNFSPWPFGAQKREEWLQGLNINILRHTQNKNFEYLFWVGCAGAFDKRIQKVTKAFTKILQHIGISFAVLGSEEKCTGDSARRLGNEYLAQMLIEENIQTFKKYNVKKIITTCPHCYNTLKNEYPDFGFKAQVFHYTEFLYKMLKDNRINLNKNISLQDNCVYHDSCYLARFNNIYKEPRKILNKLGIKVKDPKHCYQNTLCCGGGGGRMWMEENPQNKVNIIRLKELVDKSNLIISSCPFCLIMLEDATTYLKLDNVQVKDLCEIFDVTQKP